MSANGRPKCGARKKQSEGNCARPAGWGTDHPGYGKCKLHGGCVPSGRKAALEQAIQAQAASELAKLDVAQITKPLAQLQVLARAGRSQWGNTNRRAGERAGRRGSRSSPSARAGPLSSAFRNGEIDHCLAR